LACDAFSSLEQLQQGCAETAQVTRHSLQLCSRKTLCQLIPMAT
jgi:hypothetical protein